MTERDLIEEVEGLLAKATPGPWSDVGATRIWRTGSDGAAIAIIAEPECKSSADFREVDAFSPQFDQAMNNAELIKRSPELLRRLVAEVKRLRDTLTALNNCQNKPVCGHCNALLRATLKGKS